MRFWWLGWLLAGMLLLAGCGEIGLERLPTPTGGMIPGPGLQTPFPPGATPQPALLERRLLILEWPRRMWEKDSGLILLTLDVDESGRITPTIQTPDGSTDGQTIEIPNLYDTHNIVAVARLDMAGLEAYRESLRETMRPGNDVVFRWSIRADEAGVYRGVVWLHLEFVPKGGGSVEQQTMLARPIEIQAVTILGLPGNLARILGLIGLLASTLLGFPFIQRAVDALLKRLGKPRPGPSPAPAAGQKSEQARPGTKK